MMPRRVVREGPIAPERPPVLIADDDPWTRESIAVLLRGEGYAVLEAAGGDEALVPMRDATPPHLVVVLDLLMRQGTGFDVLAARHRVIVCSAFKDSAGAVGPHFAALLARLGAAFVAKPFDIDALLARVWTAERALAVCRSRRGPRATRRSDAATPDHARAVTVRPLWRGACRTAATACHG